MEITGTQIFFKSLEKERVDLIFGYPGGTVIDLYDELVRHPGIRHILVRHEQAAVHAADGYARATGKVGCCLVTSGPGATNTVTGIATAYCDSIPVVVFTGQVPCKLIGNDAFQEVDIVGITRPCTKHNFLVKDVRQLAKVIRQAFHIARSGRPGPVLVDLPKDMMLHKTEFNWPKKIPMRSYNPTSTPNQNHLHLAMKLLREAKRPLLLAGGGVIASDAAQILTALARDLRLPVVATLMGLGAFPAHEEDLWFGMVGMHGLYAANKAINGADVIMAVGARFDDRVTGKPPSFAPKAKIIHIDIDPTSVRKNVRVHVPVVGTAPKALKGIHEIAFEHMRPEAWQAKHAAWLQQLASWRAEQPPDYSGGGRDNATIKPQAVIECLYKLTKGEAIIATEVGQNQMWAAQFYGFSRPRTCLTSGGLGAMGYGFPAAIGAQLAFPDKLVVDVAGDASIQMNIQELATAVCHKLPVKILILNNAYLGMVRQWQELFYENNYSATCMESQPDFVRLAEAYGAEGFRIERPADLEPVMAKALKSPRTTIIDVRVAREENVYPMVPAGAGLDEMLLV
ncbi:MAG: biosynthetic-type acetolactate synthase large subunit [Deltaproteobacteria bacterium]|jgi:acetolactate synthase-1/2/3 large subunit|nr:biosynthetic-type acetolactate synthase large subunit [Deltaproteobacteria bacterium]